MSPAINPFSKSGFSGIVWTSSLVFRCVHCPDPCANLYRFVSIIFYRNEIILRPESLLVNPKLNEFSQKSTSHPIYNYFHPLQKQQRQQQTEKTQKMIPIFRETATIKTMAPKLNGHPYLGMCTQWAESFHLTASKRNVTK